MARAPHSVSGFFAYSTSTREMFLSRSRFRLFVLALAGAAALAAQDDSLRGLERQRIEALVAAGALPRNALAEHELEWQREDLRDELAALFAKDQLSRDESDQMLDVARKLDELAQENLRTARGRVEAGVLPPNELQPVVEAADWAAKQRELAQQRASLVGQLETLAAAETRWTELEDEELAYEYKGEGAFYEADLVIIEESFWEATGQELPISAMGRTAMHAAMGLDHIGRVDVALHPDSDEGKYLIDLLEYLGLPYLAFRSAVPGAATAPHIHIGPPSERLADEDLLYGEGQDVIVEPAPSQIPD